MKFVVSLTVNNQTVPVQFFDTLEGATTFVNSNSNPSFQIFQCTQDGDSMLDDTFDYNLEPYGRGYMLTTSEDNPLYGEKYFNGDLVEDNFRLPSEVVAKKIYHALKSKNSKSRYKITIPTYITEIMVRFCSTKFKDKIIKKQIYKRFS